MDIHDIVPASTPESELARQNDGYTCAYTFST